MQKHHEQGLAKGDYVEFVADGHLVCSCQMRRLFLMHTITSQKHINDDVAYS